MMDGMAEVARFIPTGVGNTHLHRMRQNKPTVHPHGCGEYSGRMSTWVSRSGSSPRVWGILPWPHCRSDHRRFIPTGVGNTRHAPSSQCGFSVHPHGCGEYPACRRPLHGPCGSSPRVWGIPSIAAASKPQRRFIPTGVGNTLAYQALMGLGGREVGCGEGVTDGPFLQVHGFRMGCCLPRSRIRR